MEKEEEEEGGQYGVVSPPGRRGQQYRSSTAAVPRLLSLMSVLVGEFSARLDTETLQTL